MTYTFKLARRLAQNGMATGALVALTLLGCQSDPASLESDASTIRISPRSALLAPQGAIQFSAFAEAPGGDRVPVAVTWSAEGGRIDTDGRYVAGDVDGAFRVRAARANLQWVTDSSTAIVLHGPMPTALRIHPHQVTVGVGAAVWLTAWALSAGGDSVAIPALFTAGTIALAPDSTGTVPFSADAEGEVTVTSEAGSLVDAARITVSRVAVATVEVRPDSATLAVNGTVQLTATLKDAGGRILNGRQVRWLTTNAGVAAVSPTGLVWAKAVGTAEVGAQSERKSDRTIIRVQTAPPPPPPPPLPADTGWREAFSDDFETGTLARVTGGYRWGNGSGGAADAKPAVVTAIARSGTHSLQFTFSGNPNLADDAFSEQRFVLGDTLRAVALDWWQYFPDGTEGLGAKFVHRSDPNGPENNKFLRLWSGNLADGNDGYSQSTVHLGASFQAVSGGPDPKIYTEYNNYVLGSVRVPERSWSPAITDVYRGRWVHFRFVYRAASAANTDGVTELWADGARVITNQNLPIYATGGRGNYVNRGYLMGWANSGFTQTTFTFIDDFSVLVPVP